MKNRTPYVDRTMAGNQLANYPALMNSSFRDGKHKHNRWHQDRLLQMAVKPNQFSDLPNDKYFAIVTEIVKQECSAKLLRWSSTVSEQNKKGLRLM